MKTNEASTAINLASGPFGATNDIHTDLRLYYAGLEELMDAACGPVPPKASEDSLLAISTRRAALDRAFQSLTKDLHLAQRTLSIGSIRVREANSCADAVVAGPAASYRLARGWADRPCGEEMISYVQRDLHPHELAYVSATQDDAVRVSDGLALLYDVCGELAEGVVACTRGAMVVESRTLQSGFVVPVPMVSIIEKRLLASDVEIAEALFHEACHQKLYDLIAVRDMFRSDYDFLNGPHAEIPWDPVGGRRRTMDGVRVVSTLHVYTHLLVLYSALLDAGLGQKFEARISEYASRGAFFAALVVGGLNHAGMGRDGVKFLSWLTDSFFTVSASLGSCSSYSEDAEKILEENRPLP